MQYQVPQFIEVEDKVIGPLTVKQFIYIAGTGGLCLVCFFYLPLVVAVLLCTPIVGLGGALAFYKVNGKPFIEMLEAGFNYFIGAKLFLWKHPEPTSKPTEAARVAREAENAAALPKTPKLTRGKLSQLALSLDIPQSDEEPREEVLHGSVRLTPQ